MIFEENKTAQWLGADTINFQKANLAVQSMQKKYCTPVPPSTPFSQASALGNPTSQASTKKKHSQQADPMVTQLTLSKNLIKQSHPTIIAKCYAYLELYSITLKLKD